MINPQTKGKAYEREIAKYLSKKFSTEVRRTPMSGAIHDFMSQDIICLKDSILKELHIECKRQEKLNFWAAFEKTHSLAGLKIPVVIALKNHYITDLAVLKLEDLCNLLLELEELRRKNEIKTP